METIKQNWMTFPTVLGVCGVAWSEIGITYFVLPDASEKTIEKQLTKYTGSKLQSAKPPKWIKEVIQKVKAHLKGNAQDFSSVPLQFQAGSAFIESIYLATQKIPSGTVISYGELAAKLGNPGAARAIGSALGKNPIPLIVPCHRIVAASGKLGGFSSPGGLETKIKLLDNEGVCLRPPLAIATPAQWRKAVATLQKQDELFAKLTAHVKPFLFQPHLHDEPMAALISAIVSQQLSTNVARAILARVNDIILVNGIPSAEKILALPDSELRKAGLSLMKVSFLKDLAQKYLDGKLSPLEKLQNMSDEQIIKEFTQIKGVGRWTVEMFLMFNLGRADVFPVLDLGVRKGIAQIYALADLPDPKEMYKYAENWRPYRSVAALYLWRSVTPN